MRIETRSPLRIEGNQTKDYSKWLVDPAEGNLHLKPGAAEMLGSVKRLPDAIEDIDGQKRPELTVVGADHPESEK